MPIQWRIRNICMAKVPAAKGVQNVTDLVIMGFISNNVNTKLFNEFSLTYDYAIVDKTNWKGVANEVYWVEVHANPLNYNMA